MLGFAEEAPPHLRGDSSTAGTDYGQKLEAVIPPTSKLVSKLFPKLRPDPPIQKLESQVKTETPLFNITQYTNSDNVGGIMSRNCFNYSYCKLY